MPPLLPYEDDLLLDQGSDIPTLPPIGPVQRGWQLRACGGFYNRRQQCHESCSTNGKPTNVELQFRTHCTVDSIFQALDNDHGEHFGRRLAEFIDLSILATRDTGDGSPQQSQIRFVNDELLVAADEFDSFNRALYRDLNTIGPLNSRLAAVTEFPYSDTSGTSYLPFNLCHFTHLIGKVAMRLDRTAKSILMFMIQCFLDFGTGNESLKFAKRFFHSKTSPDNRAKSVAFTQLLEIAVKMAPTLSIREIARSFADLTVTGLSSGELKPSYYWQRMKLQVHPPPSENLMCYCFDYANGVSNMPDEAKIFLLRCSLMSSSCIWPKHLQLTQIVARKLDVSVEVAFKLLKKHNYDEGLVYKSYPLSLTPGQAQEIIALLADKARDFNMRQFDFDYTIVDNFGQVSSGKSSYAGGTHVAINFN